MLLTHHCAPSALSFPVHQCPALPTGFLWRNSALPTIGHALRRPVSLCSMANGSHNSQLSLQLFWRCPSPRRGLQLSRQSVVVRTASSLSSQLGSLTAGEGCALSRGTQLPVSVRLSLSRKINFIMMTMLDFLLFAPNVLMHCSPILDTLRGLFATLVTLGGQPCFTARTSPIY